VTASPPSHGWVDAIPMSPGAITSVTSITAVTWARLLSSNARE
jgi:hypothetical protein